MTSENKPAAFDIRVNDIGKLFMEELGLTPQQGSALSGIGRSVDGEGRDLKSVYREYLQDQEFTRAARCVAAPDLFVINRIGGGGLDLEEIRLYHKKSEGDVVVATAITADGAFTMRPFDNYTAYLEWWSEKYACKNEETTANYIPPKVSLEQFLFILHAIDCFRQVSYKNMLSFKYAEKATIEFSEFAQGMAASLKSGDIRWLLPAFTVVLPGFSQFNVEIEPGDVSIVMEQNFLLNARRTSTGEMVLAFGEAGQNMGVEFYRTWMMSSGFEINVARPTDFTAIERLFVAPTALANHFVRIETVAGGKGVVNHQAYTREQLEHKLLELFERAFDSVLREAPQPLPLPRTSREAPRKYCGQCGTQLKPTARFCDNCGTKIGN
ncbi:MAG TPA: hypothetical protein DCQ14_07020 [Firmicutes bacterium]|nr:hypothetical protein [Bacillota bacterium]